MNELPPCDFPLPDEQLTLVTGHRVCHRMRNSACLDVCVHCLLQVKWNPCRVLVTSINDSPDEKQYMEVPCPMCRGLFRLCRNIFTRVVTEQPQKYGPLVAKQLTRRMFATGGGQTVPLQRTLELLRRAEDERRDEIRHLNMVVGQLETSLAMYKKYQRHTKALHIAQSIRLLAFQNKQEIVLFKFQLMNHAMLIVDIKDKCMNTPDSINYLRANLMDFRCSWRDQNWDQHGPYDSWSRVSAFRDAPNFRSPQNALLTLLLNHSGTHQHNDHDYQFRQSIIESQNPYHLHGGFDMIVVCMDCVFDISSSYLAVRTLGRAASHNFLWPMDDNTGEPDFDRSMPTWLPDVQ